MHKSPYTATPGGNAEGRCVLTFLLVGKLLVPHTAARHMKRRKGRRRTGRRGTVVRRRRRRRLYNHAVLVGRSTAIQDQ